MIDITRIDVGNLFATLPVFSVGKQILYATPLQPITLCISEICRSCSRKWATEMLSYCVSVMYWPEQCFRHTSFGKGTKQLHSIHFQRTFRQPDSFNLKSQEKLVECLRL